MLRQCYNYMTLLLKNEGKYCLRRQVSYPGLVLTGRLLVTNRQRFCKQGTLTRYGVPPS
jgi:hypothetical protein